MNVLEGSRRMRQAGRWMVFVPLTALVILIGAVEVMALFRGNLRTPLGLIPISLPLLAPGALLWVAGWIVEGFAKESR